MFCHIQGLSTITSSCWQCNLRLMLSMLCLQCPAMYNVPCTTAWLLYVRLMQNGPVSSSASLTMRGIFYMNLILCMKTTLRLSFCYWKRANGWSYLMMNREQQRRNCGRRLKPSWRIVFRMTLKLKMVLWLHWVQTTFPSTYCVKPTLLRHWIYQTSMSLQVLKVLSNSEKHLNPLMHVWNHL